MYQVELTRFVPRLTVEKHSFSDPVDAWRAIRAVVDEDCVIFVAHVEANVDYGNFHVWRQREYAFVRLDEHREHYAFDPTRAAVATEEIGFRDGEGDDTLQVHARETVEPADAMAALEYWLLTGKKLPSLGWT